MSIEYVRTMKINYGTKLDDLEFAKLSGSLADKGVYLTDSYSEIDTDNYGYKEVVKENTAYGIVIEDETQFTVDWRSDAKIIVDGLKSLHPDVHYSSITTTATTNEWVVPEGHVLSFAINLEGDMMNFDCWGRNYIRYENGALMYCFLDNDYNGMVLRFKIVWQQDKVQRKEAIEDAMVQTVLNDMGKIQKVVESRLKLKKFGYDVNDVAIDCHFDAKTESRSECTPDIIKQVREARSGN